MGKCARWRNCSTDRKGSWGCNRFSPYFRGLSIPFKPWLMKPFTNAVLTPIQSNFNYCLSSARMVENVPMSSFKGAGEFHYTIVKVLTWSWDLLVWLASVSHAESLNRKLDLTIDPNSNEIRDRATIRRLLNMTECERIPDTNREAICIRNSLAEKLWLEMQGNGVSLLNYVFY